MKPSNDAGYTLLEMIVVLSITCTILLFFSNSLMNNYRLVKKLGNNDPAYIKWQAVSRIQKDLDCCFSAELGQNSLEMEIPVPDGPDRFAVRKVRYETAEYGLIRTETGGLEKRKTFDLGNLEMQLGWELANNGTNLLVTFTDTNDQADRFVAGMLRAGE